MRVFEGKNAVVAAKFAAFGGCGAGFAVRVAPKMVLSDSCCLGANAPESSARRVWL
jgi:hypothetical protein